MDSVVVNGIRYKAVKAAKQEYVETWGCDEDDYLDYKYCFCLEAPSAERSGTIVLVDGKKVYIELGYGECEPATLQQALERIASEICY